MTVLSPVGVDTNSVIDVMVLHWDEEPQCVKGDAPATVQLVNRCCRRAHVIACDAHAKQDRAWAEKILDSGSKVVCKACSHEFGFPETYADIIDVVTL